MGAIAPLWARGALGASGTTPAPGTAHQVGTEGEEGEMPKRQNHRHTAGSREPLTWQVPQGLERRSGRGGAAQGRGRVTGDEHGPYQHLRAQGAPDALGQRCGCDVQSGRDALLSPWLPWPACREGN